MMVSKSRIHDKNIHTQCKTDSPRHHANSHVGTHIIHISNDTNMNNIIDSGGGTSYNNIKSGICYGVKGRDENVKASNTPCISLPRCIDSIQENTHDTRNNDHYDSISQEVSSSSGSDKMGSNEPGIEDASLDQPDARKTGGDHFTNQSKTNTSIALRRRALGAVREAWRNHNAENPLWLHEPIIEAPLGQTWTLAQFCLIHVMKHHWNRHNKSTSNKAQKTRGNTRRVLKKKKNKKRKNNQGNDGDEDGNGANEQDNDDMMEGGEEDEDEDDEEEYGTRQEDQD
jgi:hypothetical protein